MKKMFRSNGAFEGEKWILGSTVWFLWICTWTPVPHLTKANKSENKEGGKRVDKQEGMCMTNQRLFFCFPCGSMCDIQQCWRRKENDASSVESKISLDLPFHDKNTA